VIKTVIKSAGAMVSANGHLDASPRPHQEPRRRSRPRTSSRTMASLSRARRQIQDTQPFEVAPPTSDARERIRQSERSHGFRAAPPSYSMVSPSNRPLRTTRVASVPTQPTITEGGAAACPTTEEEVESGEEEVGGDVGFDEALENVA